MKQKNGKAMRSYFISDCGLFVQLEFNCSVTITSPVLHLNKGFKCATSGLEMIRQCLLLRLHFASGVHGHSLPAKGSGKRSFLISKPNKRDPYSTAAPQTPQDATGPFGGVRQGKKGNTVATDVSQRERFRQQREQYKKDSEARFDSSVPGSLLSPLPASARSSQGLPMDMYDTSKVRPTRDERASRIREILREKGLSSVDITQGGEADIDTMGLSPSQFHSEENLTVVPEESSLFQTILNKDALDSRSSHNSWSVLRKLERIVKPHDPVRDDPSAVERQLKEHATSSRQWDLHNGSYKQEFDGVTTLAPQEDAVASPRSSYALRKLHVDGLAGYQGMITEEEELLIADEAMTLTQHRSAAYIAEEARYCVHLYEHELGAATRDPLAFSISKCPTLERVLKRFFDLELIPSPPNVVQISEFVNTFSGYPPHKKPRSIGPYCGILNLVSKGILHLEHQEEPWYPRIMMLPRSLFVVKSPCLEEYRMGYKHTHQPFHQFDYATRVSKDYRIEIMFASVEVQHNKLLNDVVQLTEYSQSRGQRAVTEGSPAAPSIDALLAKMSSVVSSGKEVAQSLHGIGHLGSVSRPVATGTPKSRIAELKARHKLLQEKTESSEPRRRGGGQSLQPGTTQYGN